MVRKRVGRRSRREFYIKEKQRAPSVQGLASPSHSCPPWYSPSPGKEDRVCLYELPGVRSASLGQMPRGLFALSSLLLSQLAERLGLR